MFIRAGSTPVIRTRRVYDLVSEGLDPPLPRGIVSRRNVTRIVEVSGRVVEY